MKQSRRIAGSILVGALCFAMAMPAFADSKSDVSSQINSLEGQASELESELASMKANKTSIESYIAELDTKIKETLSALDTVSDEIEQTDQEIKTTKANLKEAEANQEIQYEALKARIKAIYESEEDASFFKVLLKDADLKSVLNSQEYKSRINMYDYELYNSLEATTKQIQAYEQELGEKQDSLTKDKDSYEQQMSELDTILDERKNELSSLDDSMRAAYSDISDIQSQIDAQNSKMASILAEEKAAAKAKAEHEAAVKQEASKNTDTKKSDSSTKKTDTSTKKNTESTKTETSAPETKTPETSAPETKVPETEAPSNDNSYVSDGKVLSKYHGVVYGPTGKETYYNLDMSGVVRIMRDMGFSAEDYPYWVRDDGCKMLGSYIMCAANLNYFPRGTTVASSLGTCLVCDTGSFAASNPTQLDIATNW